MSKSLYDLPKPVLIEKIIPHIQEDNYKEIARLKKQIEMLCNDVDLVEAVWKRGIIYYGNCNTCNLLFITNTEMPYPNINYCEVCDKEYHLKCGKPCDCDKSKN